MSDSLPHVVTEPPIVARRPHSPAAPVRVLLTAATFEPGFRAGGPVRSLALTVDTVSDDVAVFVVTRDRDIGTEWPYHGLSGRYVSRGRHQVFYLNIRSASHWLQVARDLRENRIDLLYVNSLFHPVFSVLPLIAYRLGFIRPRRILLAPRGELSPGAVRLKGKRKRVFLKLWTPILRSMNVIWHASTPREASDVQAWVAGAEIVVSLNQTALPEEPLAADEARSWPPRFVFLSRISPKKNLLMAIVSLSRVTRPVEFDIYGPVGDRRYWEQCKAAMASLPQHVCVRYCGEVRPEEARSILAGYDLFVFPTLGENFGHVILESLSASCPVICSDATPWSPVLRDGGGIVLEELSSEALGVDLEREACRSPAERLDRKRCAGSAFRRWRTSRGDENVLDKVLRRSGWSVRRTISV